MNDRFIRASAAATVVGIGAVAAYVSYRHALEVVRAHGETGPTAQLVPLTVDGLVYVAGMVLLDSARRRVPAPVLARVALALGIGATVAVNVLHGVAHGPVGATIAAWPAVTLVLSYELLMGMIRRGRAGTEREVLPAVATGAPDGAEGAHDPGTPDARWGVAGTASWWPLPDLGAAGEAVDRYALWETLEPVPEPLASDAPEVPDDGAETGVDSTLDPDLDRVVATARDRFAEVLASGGVPSVRAIRRELRVGHPRAVRVREALAAG